MRRLLFAVPVLLVGALAYGGHSGCGLFGGHHSSGYSGCSGYSSGYAGGCHGVSTGCHGGAGYYQQIDAGNQSAPAPAGIPTPAEGGMTRAEQIRELNELQTRLNDTQNQLNSKRRALGIVFRR